MYTTKATVSLIIIRYPVKKTFFALLAMALFRVPLLFNRKLSFYKLMGTGKKGGFSKQPDWQQWVMLVVHKTEITITDIANLYGTFIDRWFRWFGCSTCTVLLSPIKSHGTWDGESPFVTVEKDVERGDEPIAVITRATVRWSAIKPFWKQVPAVRKALSTATGLRFAMSMGEMPFRKQATFSIWENSESFKKFAYQSIAHKDVITATRREHWYKEDLFARFSILHISQSLPDWEA